MLIFFTLSRAGKPFTVALATVTVSVLHTLNKKILKNN